MRLADRARVSNGAARGNCIAEDLPNDALGIVGKVIGSALLNPPQDGQNVGSLYLGYRQLTQPGENILFERVQCLLCVFFAFAGHVGKVSLAGYHFKAIGRRALHCRLSGLFGR